MTSECFDLSPVIGLFDALSVGNDSTVVHRARTAVAVLPKETRGLGDFSPLWHFLGSGPATADPPLGFAEASPEAKHRHAVAGEIDPPEVMVKSRRRQVMFEAIPARPQRTSAFPPIAASINVLELGSTNHAESVGLPLIRSIGSAADRKMLIIQKMLAMFPQDESTLLSPKSPEKECGAGAIHVFIDNSNVLISFYDRVKHSRGYSKFERVRRPAFSFHGLSLILERGRSVAKRVLVGSSPITPVVLEARALGYETSILERVSKDRPLKTGNNTISSGSESASTRRMRKVEQAVDEIIHLKILESLLDYPPATIVLASGDGAAGEYSPGFTRVIERCLERGWNVELLAFKKNLSGFYRDREFRRKWSVQFSFVPLDGFVEELLE